METSAAARLGILMLDSRFPRVVGDIGNLDTWDFPVSYAVVPGATPDAVVNSDASPFLSAFVDAGIQLVENGCTGIATSCGFLSPMRAELARALNVPVAASALEQAAQIAASLPQGKLIGILTISKSSLSNAHLIAAGVPPSAEVLGVEDTSFAHSILGNQPDLDVARARAELVIAAKELVGRKPEVGAILLECTNMPPYASDIALATGRPVYSIYTYLRWFYESLQPRLFT